MAMLLLLLTTVVMEKGRHKTANDKRRKWRRVQQLYGLPATPSSHLANTRRELSRPAAGLTDQMLF